MSKKMSWQKKRAIEHFNRRLQDDPTDHEAWLRLMEEQGNLGYLWGMEELLARLMRRGVVTRSAVLEALVDELFDGAGRFTVVPVETSGAVTFSVRDDAGALVGTFDSLGDADEHVGLVSAKRRQQAVAALTQ
jgi:hypothetical protein